MHIIYNREKEGWFMNTWNQRFLESEYVYGEQPNTFIKEYVSFLKECPNIAA